MDNNFTGERRCEKTPKSKWSVLCSKIETCVSLMLATENTDITLSVKYTYGVAKYKEERLFLTLLP